MFDEAYPVHAFVAANKMIQLTVNGAKQCFSGSPEMPLLWYLREILGLTGGSLAAGSGFAAQLTISAPDDGEVCAAEMRNIVSINKGRTLIQDRNQSHVTFASAILLVFFAGLTFFVVSIVRAAPGPNSAASAVTFRTKCVMCHGPDGSGSAVGKSLNVPDLRSPVVQKLPDAQLAQIISDGKGGMPSFKSSLSEDQVHSLVAYVRSLRPKK